MSAPWVEEAAGLPLAFSQVREDPALDAEVLAALPPGGRAMIIASGGDTAACLAAEGRLAHLQLVDSNAAQLALTKLKFRLLRQATPEERLAVLGHAPMPPAERLAALSPEIAHLGPAALLGQLGPDHAGRYERLFAHLRACLSAHRSALAALLELENPVEQARLAEPKSPLGQALDSAFEAAMPLATLVRLFGEEATRNARLPFAQHFAQRTRYALATLPAKSNPFLWQMLLGVFPPDHPYPWLIAPPPVLWPEIAFTHGTVQQALAEQPADSLDFLHLSNVLDWLSPEAATATLAAAWRALHTGGFCIIRQLNSTLDIPAAEPRFQWLHEWTAQLHPIDRSFFYRALFIAQKEAGA